MKDERRKKILKENAGTLKIFCYSEDFLIAGIVIPSFWYTENHVLPTIKSSLTHYSMHVFSGSDGRPRENPYQSNINSNCPKCHLKLLEAPNFSNPHQNAEDWFVR
jgi:hypothetical protein